MAKKIETGAQRFSPARDESAGFGSSAAGDAFRLGAVDAMPLPGGVAPAAAAPASVPAATAPVAAAPVAALPVPVVPGTNAFAFTATTLTYTEDFNSMAVTGTGTGSALDGGTQVGTTRFVFLETGTMANATYTAGTGSANSGDTYSFGSANSTDRALGSLASGSNAPIYYGTLFTNDTGATITSLAISYVGELWRAGGRSVANGADRLDFQYSTTATTINGSGFVDLDGLDFVSPAGLPSTAGAVDGNAAANRQAVSATLAVDIPAGGSIFIRWVDTNAVGSDDGLAIDDFSITATTAGTTTETIAFQTAAISQAEGSGADTPYVFTLTRTGDTSAAASVAFAVQAGGGTTADAADFSGATSGTATFAANSATATFTILVAGDRLIEADETFTVALSSPSAGYQLSASDAVRTNTIVNDDVGGTFTITRISDAVEGGTATFSVTRTGGDGGPVDVGYAVGAGTTGSSASADDFGGSYPAGVVHFDAGQTSATVVVATTDDSIVEGDESFAVTLVSATGAGSTIGLPSSAEAVILANDPPGTVSIADVSVNEGDQYATITLTRTPATGTATVTYTTQDGTAVAGQDYVATSGTATFVGDATTATFTVAIINDALVEGAEAFTILLAPGTGNPALDRSSATVTIVDNDTPTAVGSFEITPAAQALAEGNAGAAAITFTVTRSDGSAGAVDVPYAVTFTGEQPADSDDFVTGQALNGTVHFDDGDAAAKTITLYVQGDSVLEADEGFTVALGTPSGGALGPQQSATATILNDDSTFAIAPGSAIEGSGGVPLVVTRAGDTSAAATLSYAVTLGAGDTATADDFANGVLPGGTVTFAAGATTATIVVPVADDAAIEPDETFTVTLSGAGAGQAITTAAATGSIVNDDFPTLSIGNANVIEGDDGTVALVFTVTSSDPAPAGGIGFQASTVDGTATAGSDYTALVNAAGTIAAGETSTTVTVLVNGDTMFERNETLTIALSNAVNAVISPQHGIATGTIVNDDAVPENARIFATDFTGFTAAGFSPTPTAGQLDSNVWRVVGMSDAANPGYGANLTTGDFARGVINGSADPTSGGTYSPSANAALVFQPTGSDFEPGFVEARIQNSSGASATSFDVAFDWAYRNSGNRGQALSLLYSTDGVNFSAYTGAAFTTPLTADASIASVFTNQHELANISATVADGGYLYLRFANAGAGGSGNRDEIGIDNLTIDAHLSATPTASIGDVRVSEGDAGQTLATFTITRSNGTAAASVDYATVDGTATAGSDYVAQSGSVQFAAGETSRTVSILINGDTRNEPDETFGVVLSNPVGFVVPQPRATATIVNDDTGPVAIYDIQGLGHVSGFNGQSVQTFGVVTALASNGFYLQDAVGDGNYRTSDGIFVLTASAPTVAVGNAITLTGTVTEARGHTGALTLTELTSPTAITVVQESAALPAAVVIATDGVAGHRAPPTQVIDDDGLSSYDPDSDGVDFYESLENMVVTIQTPRVVAGTNATGITYLVASDGVGATGLNDRSGMTISAGDNNPETIQVFRGSNGVNYTQGDTLNDVTGVLTYYSNTSASSGSYQVNPTVTTTLLNDAAHPARETTSLRGDAGHLSFVSFNVENLAPVPDSTVTDRNTQEKVDLAFAHHAAEVVNALGSPDVIGLQEIQDADGIGTGSDLSGTATAAKLIAAIQAAGGPTYVYVEVTPTASTGGEPNGYIRPGFLYNPERVAYVDGSARALTDAVYDGTRRPLVAEFTFNGNTFTAIDFHSTSRGGSDPLFGADQPPVQAGDAARTAQAQAAKAYIDSLLAGDPNHLFVLNGDFNGFYYETALQTLAPVDGSGALSNLILKLPSEERYTYYFDGYYQSFDNVIVSTSLYGGASFDIVHYNAGYTDGLSATDHDQPVALIGLARGDAAAMAVADRFAVTANALYRGTVLANDVGGAGTLSVTAINGDAAAVDHSYRLESGALVTLLSGGTFSYDPDGAFSGLAAGVTASDSFTYAVAGGSTATVTVTITGITTPTPDASGHVNGTAGNDSYGGTQSSDYFDLGAGGNDTVSGGAGDDAFYFGGALTGADRIIGGSGMDQVGIEGDYTGANRLILTPATFTNVELIAALPGHDYDIVLSPTAVGDAGRFTVYGGMLAAGDTLTVDGSSVTGSLIMYGGLGTDTLTGGSAEDGFYFGPGRFGANDAVHGGGGSDDQIGLDGNYTVTLDSRMDVETVALLRGPDASLNSFAVTVDDSFVEAGGTRTIYAAQVATALTIDASGERDGHLTIFGGQGNDRITGGGTSDVIFGGAGADMLRGSAGADVFLYDDASQSTGRGYDTLLDFDYSADTIRIAGQAHDTFANVAGGQLDDATFDADIQAAVGAQLVNGAAVFFTATSGSHAGETFLVVDANGSGGYQMGGDYVYHMASAPAGPTPDFIIA